MPYVNSSAIAWVDYNPATGELYIQFTSGPTVYTYYNVPQHVYDGLLRAHSKGQYFHAHIEPFHSAS